MPSLGLCRCAIFCRTTLPIATNGSPHWYDALAEQFTGTNYFALLFCFGDYSLFDLADCRSSGRAALAAAFGMDPLPQPKSPIDGRSYCDPAVDR